MKFDEMVNDLLEQNTVDESWKHKLAMGAAALGMMGGHVKGSDEGMSPKQIEAHRRIAAAEALAKGQKPAPKYSESDNSPEAQAYRARMKRIAAAEAIAKGETPAPKYDVSDNSPEAQAYRARMKRIEAGYRLANPDKYK